MHTKTPRFTETVVSLAQKPSLARQRRRIDRDKTATVILAVQGLKEHLGHPYRKLVDVIREMPRVAHLLGLTPATVPHYSTVCDRKQSIPMKQWRAILDQSVELYDIGDVQAIDCSDRHRSLVTDSRPLFTRQVLPGSV